jgi:diguanylate cyclase (GGDEF)-like protein
VAAATVLIVGAVFASPDPVTALVAATLISFVVVDAHLFFSGPSALAHLAFGVTGTTVALVASGSVPLATALALDLILAALGVVIRRLVIRAADASRDPLTGLSNRRGFDEALGELMADADRTGEPLAAALLDLDHFKAINDTSGHEAGDRMLSRVAEAWRRELPAGAVLARHGGDEFSLVLPRTTGDAALALVRQVCHRHPDLTLSCGVAAHHHGETASQLMRRADRALYEAKAAGRGRAALDGTAASARY